MLAKFSSIAPLALTGLLLTGCCCPALSGRYYEVGLPPPATLNQTAAHAGTDCGPYQAHCPAVGGIHGHGPLGDSLANHFSGPVPSAQQPPYVNPQPKFHPVPTRPVFEPDSAYPPPRLIRHDTPPKNKPPYGRLNGPAPTYTSKPAAAPL